MKIALLISGLPRMWHPCILTQINMLAPHEVGVFFHFWDVIDASEKAQLLAVVNPIAHEFEQPRDFSHFDSDPLIQQDFINLPSRMASQFYSWKKVAELFAPHAHEYDFALRTRSDLQFVNSVNYVFSHLQKNDLVIPWWNENRLVSDLFAIGDPDAILYYHRLYDHLKECGKDRPFNPEALLTRHLELSPAPFRVYTEKNQQWYFVRRPHMANMTLDECMKENPGLSKWLDPEVVGAHKAFHAKQKGEEGARYIERFKADRLNELSIEKSKN